ncbi:MAG: hypothetical protein RLZZ385_1519 [Pseudomonadota bacterium]|jgi:DNA-binding winged helix-turn-helix (wHTH) protein/TolB-like protein
MSELGKLDTFQLGPLTVDRDGGFICGESGDIKVSPRSMEVLVYLADNRERVISAEELLARFWTPLASDHAIHKAIAELRAAMGDNVRKQQFIRTVPKRGYKLLVAPPDDDPQERPAAPLQAVMGVLGHRELPGERRQQWVAACAAAVLGLLLVLALQAAPPGAGSPVIRIVVEPWQFASTDPGSGGFLTDALQAGLINRLSELPAVEVISHRVSTQPAGASWRAGPAVDYVLQGRLLQADGKIRAFVTLIRGTDGVLRWTERYDLPAGDGFSAQDDIIGRATLAIGSLLGTEQAAGGRRVSAGSTARSP